jgi:hypothetical protein
MSNAGQVTAILSVFRRPQNLRRQVQAVRFQSNSPAVVWAWVNAPTPEILSALEGSRT